MPSVSSLVFASIVCILVVHKQLIHMATASEVKFGVAVEIGITHLDSYCNKVVIPEP